MKTYFIKNVDNMISFLERNNFAPSDRVINAYTRSESHNDKDCTINISVNDSEFTENRGVTVDVFETSDSIHGTAKSVHALNGDFTEQFVIKVENQIMLAASAQGFNFYPVTK